ncbi:hypothetical protein PRIC1_000631 [Phytophthora ramorum]
MSELSKPPQKKINWLKRLNLALDDDDSSDATPQSTDPERTHKKQQKKTPVKARRDDEDGGVAVDNSIRKRKDGSGHVKDNGEEPEARRRPQKQNKSEERRKRSHHGSGSENRLEKSRTSTTVGGMDEDGGHQTKPKEQAGKMTHRKRYHAEMATKDKTDQGAVDLKPEVSVDPAKAKAAASRQRRMRKLQARRKATGEHDRLTAIKLKRHDLLKASRIKRNQRRNTGKAIAAANKNCDVKDEVLAGPRHSSSEEAKERKRMLERQRRAALKAKKELAAQSNVSSLSKHSLSADRPPNWQKRQEELRRALGAKPRVLSEEGEPSQKRHKMQLERKDASVKVIKEPALETASKISPVKSPLSNNSEARSTDKSKVGQVKIVEFQQIAKQNGEGEKGGVHTPIPPKRVTNGGVKPELDSVNTCSNQTEGADLSGGQEEPERKQDHVVKTEIQEEGQVSSPALVSGVSGETTEPQSGNEKKASDEKEGMLLDMMPIPRKAFKRGPPAENAASFVIPKRSTNGQADDHPASRATNPPEAPIPVLTKLLPSPKSSPHYSIRDPIRSQRKRKKNPVPVKKSMLSAEDRALMRLGRKRNSIFMAVSELAFQPSPCEGSKKMSTTRMMGYEVLGIDGIALPDLIPRLSCATRREMASAKDSFDSPFFGVSLSIPKAKGDNCSTVDECAGGVHKMSCYEKLEFERPEDRDFYQRRMYGTTFTPQRLRGRTTLIVRNTRFERKSTGIRFNQDRDREEFAASLSKRYTFNKSVPRCTIPRENWQKLTRNQLSTAYLHYYNREDAERASHAFYDDLGNPLELRLEYKAGVVISRSSSPAPAGRSNRAPRRSCSSERSAPEPSPLSSHGGSVRSTPHRGRERQRAANGDYRYSRYDLPPPTQFNGGDRYGSSTSGNKWPSSRSHSRLRSFPDLQHDLGATGTEVGTVAEAEPRTLLLLSQKSKEKTAPDANDHLSGSTESDKGDSQTMSTSVLTKDDKNADSNAKKPAALTTGSPHSQSATIKDDTTHEQNIGSDEEGQEEGEIENTAVDLPQLAAHGYDRKMRQSPPRHWQQPNDMQIRQRQGDFRDDPRSYSREPSWYYRPYEDHSRGPDRRRSRSRSRPRPELSAPWNEGGRDGGWDDPHSKERRRSREFGPIDSMYSGNMDRYGERDYQDYRSGGDYSGRRGDAYSRQY